MRNSIISGTTKQYYHIVQSELDMKTTSPTRDGIFKYLSQISYDKFPEFILDILVKVEGHTAIDVTDGQGDEKQDIITLNRNGQRCLTQCKHTINYKTHYNGDDLDLLVGACMRKNCRQALFVLNSDLTSQGKKYITDEEYNRGFDNQNDYREIDYWNGFRIWEKIKNNSDIINKWFSGLGQVHGLRSFKFDLSIQKLPFDRNDENSPKYFDEIFNLIKSQSWANEIIKDLEYEAQISKDYRVILKKWFQFSGNIDINFMLPNDDIKFFNEPLFALSIDVEFNSLDKKYSPKEERDKIVKKIINDVLENIDKGKWWHITTSQIKSIIYLHDISEPREIDLSSASTFVKINSCLENEYLYNSFSNNRFNIIDKEDDSIYIHKKTGIQIVQMFKQKMNPVELYNNQIRQYSNLERISNFDFFAVDNIDSQLLLKVRRLLNNDWLAFQYNNKSLIWAVEPSIEKKDLDYTHEKIKAVGLEIKRVRKEDIPNILSNVKVDLVPSDWMYISDRKSMCYPVMLDKRIFWLSKKIKLNQPVDIKVASDLLIYKYQFENKNGFDNMLGADSQNISSLEIREILFDLFTIRGSEMIDIAIYNNPISVNIRFAEGSLKSSEELVLKYIPRVEKICKEIEQMINNPTLPTL